ncbi:MAG: hypothetical protein ACI81T_002254 [Bacteroidia bacterium]|jgi:hypothetical protein
MEKDKLIAELAKILDDNNSVEKVYKWHEDRNFGFINSLIYGLEELYFHPELFMDKRVELLTNREFLVFSPTRKSGLQVLPNEWINPESAEVDEKTLYELWLRPEMGHIAKLAEKNQVDTDRKNRMAQKRGFFNTQEERKSDRILKLKESVGLNRVAILLGRHTREYIKLQKQLNSKYQGKIEFVSDHIWSKCGYVERGMKISNNLLSVIQACETVHQLPNLGFEESQIQNRSIMISLDGYDVKAGLSAIYSNPNYIARTKPFTVSYSEKPVFAHTGLTDLEISNVVRNKNWFDVAKFCRTGENGNVEELSRKQVASEYGIKYIGDRLKKNV